MMRILFEIIELHSCFDYQGRPQETLCAWIENQPAATYFRIVRFPN
jgi:hypothetical protein